MFGISPLAMLFASMRLTSGSMWVRQVVKTTPPPKQARADMSLEKGEKQFEFKFLARCFNPRKIFGIILPSEKKQTIFL